MKITHDKSADALYIKLRKGRVYKTINRGDSLIDLDKRGKIIGVEVLHYSKVVPKKSERSSIFVGQKRILLPA